MFHKALELEFKDGTELELTFQDGKVKQYDMAVLFTKYPQLHALENRDFFLSGQLMGSYGIRWNDDLDIDVETIYEEGRTVRLVKLAIAFMVGEEVMHARTKRGLTQKQLSEATGIDQSDLSKIERGMANVSVSTLNRIALALGCRLNINFSYEDD